MPPPGRRRGRQTQNPNNFSDEEIEDAWRAVQNLNRMLPQLQHFARNLTGNPKVTVRVNHEVPSTQGNLITIRPPMGLGKNPPHRRADCGDRDENGRQKCPACKLREVVEFYLFHEIGHVAKESQGATTSEAAEAFESYLNEWHPVGACDHAVHLRAKLPYTASQLSYAKACNKYLPMIVNCLEDARVNEGVYELVPGMRKVFDLNIEKILDEGIDIGVGSDTSSWMDAPLDSQFMIGFFLVASRHDIEGRLHSSVVEALRDEDITAICAQADTAPDASRVFALGVEAFRVAQRLGFCVVPKCQVAPPSPPDEDPGPGEPASGEGSSVSSEDASRDDEGSDDSGDSSDSSGTTPSGDGDDPDDEGDSGATEEAESSSEQSSDESGDGAGEDTDSDDDEADEADSSAGGGPGDEDSGSDDSVPGSSDGDDSESDDDSDSRSGSEPQSPNDAPGDDDGSGDDGDGDPSQHTGTDGQGDADRDQEESDEDSTEDDAGARDSESGDTEGSEPEGERSDEDADPAENQDDKLDPDDEADPWATDGSEGDGRNLTPVTVTEPDDIADPLPVATPDDVADALGRFLMHGNPDDDESEGLLDRIGEGDLVEMIGEEEGEPLAQELQDLLRLAIKQVLYFDTASRYVAGVEVLTWPHMKSDWYQRRAWADFAPPESVVGGAILRGRRTFDDNKRKKHVRNVRSGKINTRALGRRAPVGDDRIFQKSILPGRRSYMVVITGDASGSTDADGRNEKIKRAMFAQGELLTRLGVPFEMWFHTAWTQPQHKMGTVSYYTGQEYYVYMYPVKQVHEGWNDLTKTKLANMLPIADNLDGHTLEFVRKRVEKSDATDKIIMYYTDGEMPAANAVEEREVLIRETEYCERKGITLLGVGVHTDSPKHYGMDTVRMDTDEDIIKVLEHLEHRLER